MHDNLDETNGAQVDESAHNAPLDIGELLQQHGAFDGHDQNDVLSVLHQCDPPCQREYIEQFKAAEVKTVSLRKLRDLHDTGNANTAIALLHKRHCLKVEPAYLVEKGNQNLVAQVGPHYLDCALYVGSCCGMDATLANVNIDHNWTVKLHLSTHLRLWPDKNASILPFHPQGRMMSIGTHLNEQLWLAMAPNVYFEADHLDNTREQLPVLDAPSTALSARHHLMVVMFIACVLETIRHQDITCINTYPEPLTRDAVTNSTEVL